MSLARIYLRKTTTRGMFTVGYTIQAPIASFTGVGDLLVEFWRNTHPKSFEFGAGRSLKRAPYTSSEAQQLIS